MIACDSIKFISREEWGALPSNLTTMKTPVNHVFIHHTEGQECHTFDECVKYVKWCQHFHNVTRGFGDIGYNFLIGGDGNVYVGRDWDKDGRHTKGMNTESVAFSLIGTFKDKEPNSLMLNATINLIECGVDKGIVVKDYELHGHRDQVCTDCPGDKLFYLIKSWPNFVSGPLKTYVCENPNK
jgi:N-acetylmuramoyl-L-alanine amidase